jgi:hypothetical protein
VVLLWTFRSVYLTLSETVNNKQRITHMTTETITISTVSTGFATFDREEHRKACAYLKGFIVKNEPGSSKRDVKTMSPEFKEGMDDSCDLKYPYYDSGKKKTVYLSEITFAHILHNRLRHRRPHLGSEELDSAFLKAFSQAGRNSCFPTSGGYRIEKALGKYDIDIAQLTGGTK